VILPIKRYPACRCESWRNNSARRSVAGLHTSQPFAGLIELAIGNDLIERPRVNELGRSAGAIEAAEQAGACNSLQESSDEVSALVGRHVWSIALNRTFPITRQRILICEGSTPRAIASRRLASGMVRGGSMISWFATCE
jgi:hypothetical protein